MDIFCQLEDKLQSQIIDKSENFYLLHDGYPLSEGHLLLIPKKHVDCFLNLDKKLTGEFNSIKFKTIEFLKKQYCQPVIFEHGIAGQTVLHAHLHLLPTDKLVSEELKKYGSIMKNPTVPYLYFEYLNFGQYYSPKLTIKPGLFHSYIYAGILNRPTSGYQRAKELSKWLLKVKKYYALWRVKH